MKNQYLRNLNKIEFVVTYACTGRCKHCSEGDHASCGERIDPKIAADAACDAKCDARIAADLGQGSDHVISTAFPEARYLKGLMIVRCN